MVEDVSANVSGGQVANLRAGPQLTQVGGAITRHVRVVTGGHDHDARTVNGRRKIGDVRELVHNAAHKLQRLLASVLFLQAVPAPITQPV